MARNRKEGLGASASPTGLVGLRPEPATQSPPSGDHPLRVERILDVLAHCGAAWTFGEKPDHPDFRNLKAMHRNMPSNRYKAERIAEMLAGDK